MNIHSVLTLLESGSDSLKTTFPTKTLEIFDHMNCIHKIRALQGLHFQPWSHDFSPTLPPTVPWNLSLFWPLSNEAKTWPTKCNLIVVNEKRQRFIRKLL